MLFLDFSALPKNGNGENGDGENGDDEEVTDDAEGKDLPRTGGYPYFNLGLIALAGGTFILKKRK